MKVINPRRQGPAREVVPGDKIVSYRGEEFHLVKAVSLGNRKCPALLKARHIKDNYVGEYYAGEVFSLHVVPDKEDE